MSRGVLLIAVTVVLSGASCKKQPPPGDLPPARDWQAQPGVAAPPANPHAGMAAPPANPHAGMAAPPANPHAGMAAPPTNPHAGMAASSGDPHGPAATPTGPKTLDKLPDGRFAMGPFSLAAPAGWTIKPVTSSMRAADFELPAKAGAEAELVVYYFGENGAGSVDDNLDRWLGQFQQPDGRSSRDAAKIEKTKFGGQDATFVSVSGRYVNQGMPGGAGPADKPDQSLLAAIVGSPSGPYYFKLVGAKPTVDANAAAFRGMLDSLKVR